MYARSVVFISHGFTQRNATHTHTHTHTHSSVHVLDPSQAEESVAEGKLTFVTNSQKDLCTLSKAGGIPLSAESILHCVRIAQIKAADITTLIKEAIARADEVPATSATS